MYFKYILVYLFFTRDHLLTSGSSAVNGCRQWESEQLIKHHNNPQVIHTPPVHQLMSCETKATCFVLNKSIIKNFYFKSFLMDKIHVLCPYCFLQWKSLAHHKWHVSISCNLMAIIISCTSQSLPLKMRWIEK